MLGAIIADVIFFMMIRQNDGINRGTIPTEQLKVKSKSIGITILKPID